VNLGEAIERAERGLIDADLGGGSSSNGWRGSAAGEAELDVLRNASSSGLEADAMAIGLAISPALWVEVEP